MKKIRFKSLDGLRVYGHISTPAKLTKSKRYPAMLFITGGIHGGVYSKNTRNYDPLHAKISKFFNERGFVTLIVDKRGSKGHGKKYMGLVDCCGDEVFDIIAGGKYLKKLDFVDKNRIFIHGTSRGATLAALVLTKTDIFKLGILASGFYDLLKEYNFEKKYRPDIFPTKQALGGKDIHDVPYGERSPINYASKINCPILIVHGLDDPIAPPKFSNNFYKSLKKLKKDVEIILYKSFAHKKIYSCPTKEIGKIYWGDVLYFINKKFPTTPSYQ